MAFEFCEQRVPDQREMKFLSEPKKTEERAQKQHIKEHRKNS